jgi:hypothetical protein
MLSVLGFAGATADIAEPDQAEVDRIIREEEAKSKQELKGPTTKSEL